MPGQLMGVGDSLRLKSREKIIRIYNARVLNKRRSLCPVKISNGTSKAVFSVSENPPEAVSFLYYSSFNLTNDV